MAANIVPAMPTVQLIHGIRLRALTLLWADGELRSKSQIERPQGFYYCSQAAHGEPDLF